MSRVGVFGAPGMARGTVDIAWALVLVLVILSLMRSGRYRRLVVPRPRRYRKCLGGIGAIWLMDITVITES